MTEKQIARINELSRKQRSVGLTDEERAEQKTLRDEYRTNIRGSLEQRLDNIYYKMPDGSVVKCVPQDKQNKAKEK